MIILGVKPVREFSDEDLLDTLRHFTEEIAKRENPSVPMRRYYYVLRAEVLRRMKEVKR